MKNIELKSPYNIALNCDCMEYMKTIPDKFFALAIVDPPYGIDFAKTHTGRGWVVRESKDWDDKIPPKEYFLELYRISKNQIIWGANYMVEYLSPSMGWIFWDKGQRDFSLADGELAYTSFDRALRVYSFSRAMLNKLRGDHPTEKPIALYSWIIKNYSEHGDNILDTHLGSGSSRIACHKAGLDFVGCEIDKDYFDAQEKRFQDYLLQLPIQFTERTE